MPLRSLLLGVLLAAALSTGCGREDPKRIPANRASELTSLVDQAGRAVGAGECDAAREAVLEARRSVSELPRRVDPRLEENLRGWLRQLDQEIRSSCHAAAAAPPAAEPTASATPSAEPTAAASPEPSPSSTPEATATTTPEATIDPGTGGEEGPSEEQPPPTGVPPVEDEDDE